MSFNSILLISSISMAVSVIILAIYRQMDKNNRSFEKIARLSKNIKEDLAKFAEDKFQSLRDFDNCIDVSIQKGSTLIENLYRSIDELQDRYRELDNEKEKISNFYKKIDMVDKDLAGISGQVKEIHESSDFIKNVEDKLSRFKREMAIVEKNIERIEDDLKKDNAINLKNVANQVVKETEHEIKGVRNEVYGLKKEIETRQTEILDTIGRSEKGIKDNIERSQKIINEYVQKQESFFKSNREKMDGELASITSKVDHLKDNFLNVVVEEMNNLNNINNYKYEQMKNDFARIENEFNARIDTKVENFSRIVNELEDKGNLFGQEITEVKNRQVAEIRSVYQNILKEIDRYNERLRNETRNNLVKSLKDSEDRIRLLNDNFRKVELNTNNRITGYEQLLEQSSEKFEGLKNKISLELEEKIKDFDRYINESGEVVIENINKSLNSISGDAFKKTNEITERFEGLYNEVENKIHGLEKNLTDRTKVIETALIKNQKDTENRLKMEIESRYDGYKKSIHDDIVTSFGDMSGFVDQSKNELTTLKTQLADFISGSIEEVRNSKGDALKTFEEASAGIDNQILDFEDKINDAIGKQETKLDVLEKDIFKRIGTLKDSLLDKIEDINYQYDSKFNEISNKSFDVERLYNENLDKIYNEGIGKFKAIEDRYDRLAVNADAIDKKINEEIVLKMEEGSKKLVSEYKNLENESVKTITGYKNDILKIKQTLKLVEEKYAERLSGKFDETDKKLINKMKDVNEIVERIKEVNDKYNDKLSGLDGKIADFETGLQKRSEIILNDMDEKSEKLFNEKTAVLNNLESKYVDLENNIKQAHEKYNALDGNFRNLFAEKLNDVDAKIIDKMNEINGKYNYHINDLNKKLVSIEDEFKGKLVEVEEEYKIRGEEAISSKFERLNEFVRQFDGMEKQLDELKSSIDNDIEGKILTGKKDMEDLIKYGREEFSRQYKEFEQDASGNIARYNSDMEKISQKIKLIDEKFSGKFVKKLGEADAKLVEKLRELNDKLKISLDEFNGKIGYFENDFTRKLGEIEQRYVEKGERMVYERSRNLDELKNRFDEIQSDISDVKNALGDEISRKISEGKEELDVMLSSGKQKAFDEYAALENETMKNIADFRNEIVKIKQNIQQIDDKFIAKFDRKLGEVDERVNDKINEVSVIYKDNIQELNNKLKNMEYEFEKKVISLEDGYNEKGNTMVARNMEKVDEIRRIFGEINQDVARLKDNINEEVTSKIENAKDELAKIYEIGNTRLIENYKDLEDKAGEKIRAYWNEIEDIKSNMDILKTQFNDKIGDKLKALNLNVNERIKEVNDAYSSNIDGLNGKMTKIEEEHREKIKEVNNFYLANIVKLEDEFRERIKDIETDFNGKEKELYNNSYNELNEFAKKFGMLNQEINNLRDHLDGDIEGRIAAAKENLEKYSDNVSFKMNEKYKSLEEEAEKKILTYKSDLSRIKETIQKIDKYYRENTLERIKKMDTEFDARFVKADEKWNNKLGEIDASFNNELGGIRNKLAGIEDEIKSTLAGIGAKADEKTESMLKSNIEKLDDFAVKFGEIENDLSVMKNRIDGEIDGRIEDKMKEIDIIINGEAEKIFDEYKLIEAKSIDKITAYRHELAELKDSIKQIDDSYTEFMQKKIDEMDDKFNVSRFEIDERFKFNVNELNDKFRLVETELNQKMIEIESNVKSRNEKILEENALKLDEFGGKFEELNSGINELRENLLTDITEKIGRGKDDLDNILIAGTEKLVDEYRTIEKESSRQIDEHKNELSKLKKNIELIDEKYNLRFIKKLEDYDRQFSAKIDSINLVTENMEEIYKDHSERTEEIKNKIRGLEQTFGQRLVQIEDQYRGKSDNLIETNEKKIAELASRFELVNNQITALQTTISDEVKMVIENGKKTLGDEYIALEENTKKKISEYKVTWSKSSTTSRSLMKNSLVNS